MRPTCQRTHSHSANMIITLLLICQAGGEWVQISQQHYRKPYRSTQYFAAPENATEIYEEDITAEYDKPYVNQSLPELNWKETDKMYPRGTVTRVKPKNEHTNNPIYREPSKLSSATITRNSDKNSHVPKFGFIIEEDDEDDVSDLYNFKFSPGIHENDDDERLFSSERTTTGKYPNLNKLGSFDIQGYKRYQPSVTGSTQNEDIFEGSFGMFAKKGNIKRVQLDSRTVRTPIIKLSSKDDYISKFVTEDIESTTINIKTVTEATNTNEKINGVVKENLATEQQSKKSNKANSTKELQEQIRNDFRTEDTHHENIKQTLDLHQLKNINRETPYFVTRDEAVDDHIEATVSSETIVNKDNSESKWKVTAKVPTSTDKISDGYDKDGVKDTLTDENKVNILENIAKFMKTVADTISRNTRRSVNSKVRYLQNLQDTILANIKQRIDTTWPDDVPTGAPPRRTRSADHTSRGHVEFPSSESALMTISFLTFAVYLIKLILQVIQAYKNKSMMVAPAVLTAVGRAAALAKRHAAERT